MGTKFDPSLPYDEATHTIRNTMGRVTGMQGKGAMILILTATFSFFFIIIIFFFIYLFFFEGLYFQENS